MVYLSTTYPGYFAAYAAESSLLLVELDFGKLDQALLYPDEDFLAYVVRVQEKLDLQDSQAMASELLLANQSLWRGSLSTLGNVAYLDSVEPSLITRYATLCANQRTAIADDFLNPSVSPENFRALGDHYRSMVAWLFGDEATHPSLTRTRELHDPASWVDRRVPKELEKHRDAQLAKWERESNDRTGIEVITL